MFGVSACNLNIRMQIKALSCLLTILGATCATFFDMPRIREFDFLDESAPSLSEKLEAAELAHPMLGADRVQDVRMTILNDFNHVLPFKLGNSNMLYKLVPDTMLNEVAVMTINCKNCTGVAPEKWTPPGNLGNKKNVTGQLDEITYFYKLHAFDTQVKGTFYKLPGCIEHSPNPSICLLNL